MFSATTIYRSGSRVVEVLPGESHSPAWVYITAGGPAPSSLPRSDMPATGRVRRRAHRSSRRPAHRRHTLTPLA